MHGNLARIELGKKEIPKMLNLEIAEVVANEIKELGFEFVTLDLKGRDL
jgi:PP-loop superfamily ATP-utilizing enzyme